MIKMTLQERAYTALESLGHDVETKNNEAVYYRCRTCGNYLLYREWLTQGELRYDVFTTTPQGYDVFTTTPQGRRLDGFTCDDAIIKDIIE